MASKPWQKTILKLYLVHYALDLWPSTYGRIGLGHNPTQGEWKTLMDKDGAEILRILESCDEFSEVMYEAAEWCYRTHKDAIQAELFMQRVKDMWNDLHEAQEL